ncbi:hypothetical protein CHCC20441_3422 [Bacillus licheniformis]|uniref:Uncharacterized protein n=1 Tax=Bacillus licheniformis TaxID=1402 RepID=A0A8B5Y842_BACLI|nr:hypothetical protein B4092_1728 [Bacillus licheniformis]TWJ55425.1 hypothetical protein CHCC5023_2623 [Bacillus paralicheniformis]TWN17121.1 hypothetical protein CHCC14564_1686 [Bacillus licheniformis LMG 17339]KYC85640.1 hypothetical protein B4091_1617 [Bacillus licheniformis]KYC97520.1 hypothetical protein B4164_1615 [Bacillus licheniformis]
MVDFSSVKTLPPKNSLSQHTCQNKSFPILYHKFPLNT